MSVVHLFPVHRDVEIDEFIAHGIQETAVTGGGEPDCVAAGQSKGPRKSSQQSWLWKWYEASDRRGHTESFPRKQAETGNRDRSEAGWSEVIWTQNCYSTWYVIRSYYGKTQLCVFWYHKCIFIIMIITTIIYLYHELSLKILLCLSWAATWTTIRKLSILFNPPTHH